MSGDVVRYVVLKASGSRFAYVQDTRAGRTVKRYNIFKNYAGIDGWSFANRHASRLNAAISDHGRESGDGLSE